MAIDSDDYSPSDFKHAIAALLPAGDYWQYETGDPLDKLLSGLATECKTINDETKVSLLSQPNNAELGWRIADYQRIITDSGVQGWVSDNSATPNIIHIEIAPHQASGLVMQSLDAHRLPHTAFYTTYNQQQNLYVAMARQSLQVNRHERHALSFNAQVLHVVVLRRHLHINRHTMRDSE